ncbi:MAG: FtsH protease activity modulator HflK [Gammaproteobacteria bacterium]|nr:FtsH protease activity modulator HflK [Gammaproteobacteria bacterium]
MAWNVPGGSGDKDPWGQRKRTNASSSDLDRMVSNIQQKLAGLFGANGNGRGFGIGLVVAIAIGLWLASGYYVIQEGERGVELRFGRQVAVTERGLSWHWPFPIESVEKVDIGNVQQMAIGYRTNERTGTKSKEAREALMLTGDENIVDVEFNVQYQIKDPAAYLFNVQEPEATLRQATESAVREVIGRSKLDFVLTEGRQEIDTSARELLQKIIDRYHLGVTIVAVNMLPAQPPNEVRAAFDDVNKAREDLERQKNEAEGYANDVIPRARGAAARVEQEAEAYKTASIAHAEGDAHRFNQVVKEYLRAPAVTRERLYIETMEQVLSNTTKVFVDQKNGNNLLYLPLDKLIPPHETAAATNPTPPMSDLDSLAPPREPLGRGRTDTRRRSGAGSGGQP